MVCVFSILRFLSPPPKISRGEKIFHGGGHAVLQHSAQTFLTGGRSARKRRARAPVPPVRPSVPPVIAASGHAKCFVFAAFLPWFSDCGRNGRVSTVRLDVIHLRGRCPSAVPGTLTAKRLSKELAGPQVLRPLRGKVHPVPGLGRGAASVLWAVEITVAVGDQGSTSRMPAGAQRLVSHGLSPPDKIKTPEPMTKPAMGDHGLRRSTLRPLAISRMISVLQSLQYTGRPVASVSSSIRSSL